MDERFRAYIQKERIAAIDETMAALREYMVEKRQISSMQMWDQYALEFRETVINGGRDAGRERKEPIIRNATCAHLSTHTGKKCSRAAVVGAYCRAHGKGRVQLGDHTT